jgi:hypothetical protein
MKDPLEGDWLDEAQKELNRAKGEITDAAADRLIIVCQILIYAIRSLRSREP